MNYKKAQLKIKKIIQSMTGKYNTYTIWRDFITLAACTISNSVDKSQWQEREDMYMKTIEKYERDEANKFAEMLALVTLGLESGQMGDFLGELYMQLEMGNRDTGQFFTPYNVSKMMARLIDAKEENGIVKLNEPSCGSGGMIIAYAETMKIQDINYQEKLRVVCNDLDYDVVKMAYIQLSLLGIDAVIMQGNTLTLKMNEVWYTPMHFVNLAREKERQSNDNAERMLNIMKDLQELEEPVKEPIPIAAGQTNIFDFL